MAVNIDTFVYYVMHRYLSRYKQPWAGNQDPVYLREVVADINQLIPVRLVIKYIDWYYGFHRPLNRPSSSLELMREPDVQAQFLAWWRTNGWRVNEHVSCFTIALRQRESMERNRVKRVATAETVVHDHARGDAPYTTPPRKVPLI